MLQVAHVALAVTVTPLALNVLVPIENWTDEYIGAHTNPESCDFGASVRNPAL